jgi:hypothetical protein
MQFDLLTRIGLKEDHHLLDIGCGSLAAGRLLIPYLHPGRYFGLEPEEWLVDEGIAGELGEDIRQVKRPTFSHDPNFNLTTFGRSFDFLVAQSIFTHASQAQIARCLGEARLAMGVESIFVATFMPADQSYDGNEWTWLAGYTPERMIGMAVDAGLSCDMVDYPHPSGQQWIVLRVPGGGPAEELWTRTLRPAAESAPTISPRTWELDREPNGS